MPTETGKVKRPLDAEYIHSVNSAALRAISDIHARRKWGDGKWSSPVATHALCVEISRLNIEQESLLGLLREIVPAIRNIDMNGHIETLVGMYRDEQGQPVNFSMPDWLAKVDAALSRAEQVQGS